MRKSTCILLLVIIVAAGALFRLWDIHTTPPGLYPDEAMNANDAIESIETETYHVFYSNNNGREGLFVWLTALSFSLFGVSASSLRLVSAVGGIAAIPGVYFLTQSLLRDRRVALLASAFTAISFWHILFSRIGFRAIWMITLLVWGVWLLWDGMRRASYWRMTLSGAFIGLSAYTYVGVRVFPLALGVIAVLLLFQARWQKQAWMLMGTAAITALIVVAPLGVFFLQNPEQISARTGDVSIFGADEPLKEMLTSTIKTAGMFHVFGDCNWRHNYASPLPLSGRPCAPMLLWPVGIFALLGFFVSLGTVLRGKEHRGPHVALLIWFGVMLLPAVLTREGIPHALRSIGVIPIPYIYAAVGSMWSVNKLGKPRAWWIAALVVIIGAVGTLQADKYFIQWGKAPETHWAFEQPLVDAAELLLTAPSSMQRIVVVNKPGVIVDDVPMPAQTIKFIMNEEASRRQNTPRLDHATRYLYLPALESTLTETIGDKPTAILFLKSDLAAEQDLIEAHPKTVREQTSSSTLLLIP